MPLEIVDIRTCWEAIRPGLEAIRAKCAAEWRPEDVYHRCVAGEWTLFTAPEGAGFVVLYQYVSPYSGDRRLVVECGYHVGAEDPFDVYEPQIMEIGRRIGAARVEFKSPRRGFERKGWTVDDICYSKEVGHG